MVKEILQRYLDKIATKVDMKEERELAERYLSELKALESDAELEKAN